MHGATVIPDGHVVLVQPAVSYMHVVIGDQQVVHPVLQSLAFFGGYPVDLGDMMAQHEEAVPSRHGIGADHRVLGLDMTAPILWCTPGNVEVRHG